MSQTVVTATRPIHTVSGSAGLFACYEAAASLSEDMVDAAEHGDWDGVSLLERECTTRMERSGHGLCPALSHEEVQHRCDLMIRILANNARVRALACLHQNELIRLVSEGCRVINVRQACVAVSYY